MRLTDKGLSILLMLMGFVILTGCANVVLPPQNPVIADVRSYFPAEPGLTWAYEGTGNEYASFTRKVMFQQGNQVQIVENNGGTSLGQVYQVTGDAVIQTFSREEFYSDESLLNQPSKMRKVLLQAPLKAGAVWQDDQNKCEVVSINETVQVPAGTFLHVVKVKRAPLDQQVHYETFEYYAPNTGLILREFIADSYAITSKLKSFKKPPAAAVKEDTLILEGMPQKFLLQLVEGDPLPFYTYKPQDMVVSRVTSGEGTGVRFNSNFAGKRRDDVYLALIFYPLETKLDEGIRNAEQLISAPDWQKNELPAEKRYSWAVKQWSFHYQTTGFSYNGSLTIGQHNNRIFYIMSNFPVEFADGFLPRSQKILSDFVWTDTHEKLINN